VRRIDGNGWEPSGLAVTGVARVLLAAKKAGLVRHVRPFLERLEVQDFRLSDQIVRAVLEQAGEG
jgi:predicted nucleic acid-binding protein